MNFIEPKVSPYVDYPYYTEMYKGTEIKDAAEFDRLVKRVSVILDEVTFDRVKKLDGIPDIVKDCLCGMAETYGGLEVKGSEKKVTAESNDGFSQSFKEYDEVNIKSQTQNVARSYLTNTGLLYRGWRKDDYKQ